MRGTHREKSVLRETFRGRISHISCQCRCVYDRSLAGTRGFLLRKLGKWWYHFMNSGVEVDVQSCWECLLGTC